MEWLIITSVAHGLLRRLFVLSGTYFHSRLEALGTALKLQLCSPYTDPDLINVEKNHKVRSHILKCCHWGQQCWHTVSLVCDVASTQSLYCLVWAATKCWLVNSRQDKASESPNSVFRDRKLLPQPSCLCCNTAWGGGFSQIFFMCDV